MKKGKGKRRRRIKMCCHLPTPHDKCHHCVLQTHIIKITLLKYNDTKRKNGEIGKYGIKTRLKPRRTDTKSKSSMSSIQGMLGFDMNPKGRGQHQPHAIASCSPRASVLGGFSLLPITFFSRPATVLASPTSCCLQLFLSPLSQLHMLPSRSIQDASRASS